MSRVLCLEALSERAQELFTLTSKFDPGSLSMQVVQWLWIRVLGHSVASDSGTELETHTEATICTRWKNSPGHVKGVFERE